MPLSRSWRDYGSTFLSVLVLYFVYSEVKGWYDDREARKRALVRKALMEKMHLSTRDDWKEEELKIYDGTNPDLPIIVCVNGRVFNVWRGADFYGQGGPY